MQDAMNWRERIVGIYQGRCHQPGIAARPEFCPPASASSIADAETALGAALPASLRSLLLETNGVMEMLSIDGGDWFDSMWLLWDVDEIIEQNRYLRSAEGSTYERDFRRLVFFAGAGADGILFAFPVENRICGPRVAAWRPIANELDELAPSLEDFLCGWLTGTITV